MDSGLLGIVLRFLLGAGVGFTIGLTGVGGGVLVVPALTVILRLPPTIAIGTASLYAFLARIYAAVAHCRLGTVDYRIAKLFLIGAIPGNIVTALLITGYVSRHADDAVAMATFQGRIRLLVAAVMFGSGTLMCIKIFLWRRRDRQADGGQPQEPLRSAKLLGITAGLAVGALIGATSIGGGVILVPVLILFFRLPAVRTVGTSVFITLALTLVTAVIYGKGAQMHLPTAMLMFVGSLGGVHSGSQLATKVPERALQAIVITLIVIAAIMML